MIFVKEKDTNARSETQSAIRDGRLTEKPCEICGNENSLAHHDNYEKPLDVRWLCHKCHAQLHSTRREK